VESQAAWEQIGDARDLPFEALNSFLGLPAEAPAPWVLVDLNSIWVAPGGVPETVSDEIGRLALSAFRLCTNRDEWIWAWDAVDEYSDRLYRFWPHRAEDPVDWLVGFYPNGDDQVFVSQAFDWGVYASWSKVELERDDRALYVFGKPLLDAYAGHWPGGWSEIIRTSGVDAPVVP
jgi:hypothetical protein